MAVEDGYERGYVCLNGHWVNRFGDSSPEGNFQADPACGSGVISACPECAHKILGHRRARPSDAFAVLDLSSAPRVPAFCHHCGEPYPWTAAYQEAYRELMALSPLTDAERADAQKDLDALVSETPKTPVAIARTKRVLTRLGAGIKEEAEKLLVKIVTEAAARALGLPH